VAANCTSVSMADTGRIAAAALTTNDLDDGSQVGPLLDQIDDAIASFTGERRIRPGRRLRRDRRPPCDAAVIVPPRSNADAEPDGRDGAHTA